MMKKQTTVTTLPRVLIVDDDAMVRLLAISALGQLDLDLHEAGDGQACLRPRERFWDIPVPKIDSAFDNLFVPQPSWSPGTTQQLRKLVAAPYLAPNDWTPRSEAYFVFPLAQGTPGKQCGLAATGVYQPSLRSPWLAAAEAVELFRQQTYDIVLLDLEMPLMDGFTAARKIRALRALRALPGGESATLIMVTGLNDADSIEKAYEVGATDFVTKPINWAILRQRLRFVLRAREAFRSLQENEAKLLESQRIANLGHWEWDIVNNQAEWSEQVYEILGLTPQSCEASFATFLEAVHPDEQRLFSNAVSAAVGKGESYVLEHRIVRPDGEERYVVSQGQALPAEPGKVERVRHVVQDITERKRTEEHIFQLANFDSLTGLPNRELFKAYAGRLLAVAKRDGTRAAVLLLDLDRFKRINDSLGYNAGDQLIKEVAGRIASCMRECDLAAKVHAMNDLSYSLARPGGDEFMLLIRGVDRADGVARFAQRLSEVLAQPLSVMQQEIFSAPVSVSACFPMTHRSRTC